MPIEYNEINAKANGGTEIMARKLESVLPPELMEQVQIIPSRLRCELDPTKVRIYWAHDLPGDPEANAAVGDGGWARFHKVVFVSNWQMQAYVQAYGIPWSKCEVIQNAVVPFENDVEAKFGAVEPIRLIYHTTPHRGLNILAAVFEKLVETEKDVVLDVYSSFGLYGMHDRDEAYREVIEKIKATPGATYHGAVDQDTVREAVAKAHVFAYPSTWVETSCLCLMEAMQAGAICVHPNYGALYETAANWTMQYQWKEQPDDHASVFYAVMRTAIDMIRDKSPMMIRRQVSQSQYSRSFYSWAGRDSLWSHLVTSLLSEPREIQPNDKGSFVYRAG